MNYSTRHNDNNDITGYLRRILDVLQENQHGSQKASISTRRRTEWMLFAYVIDRVLFVTFVSLGASLGLILLMQYAYIPPRPPDLDDVMENYVA